jgi:hypothetical protein
MAVRLFFISGGGGQIRGIDDRHGLPADGQKPQKPVNQLFVNPAQARHARVRTKLEEHADIRRTMPVVKQRKPPPGRLLRQQTGQGIETGRRT